MHTRNVTTTTGLSSERGHPRGSGRRLLPDPSVRAVSDFDGLTDAMERQLDSLVGAVLERMRDKGLALDKHDTEDWNQIRELTRDSLQVQLRNFRFGILPRRCPDIDVGAVGAFAKLVGLELLRNSYRLCQMTLWEAWFALVEDSAQISASERRELLSRGSDFFFRYADLLSDYAAEVYEREVERLWSNGEQRRLREIRALLDDDPLAASSLDFDLDRHHLGLIAWGVEPAHTARQLARALRRPLLAVSPFEPGHSCWAWISGSRPLGPVEEKALASFKPERGRVAVGLEAFGEEGFRASHRQALRARRFARESGPRLLRYEDVAVEALASENEDDARAFVAHELRGIEDDSATSQRIRETLEAYFASGYNAACAGATLGVHQQTVANRLRTAEERLGQKSICVRRVELEMALRLRACLAREESSAPTG